jgi:anaerobic selenocysteine-containing dehydrogenase
VRGACPHDCPDTCALLTTVENGRATKVQGNPAHAQTDGVLCTKVSRYTERTYHPDRLLDAAEARRPQRQRASLSLSAGTSAGCDCRPPENHRCARPAGRLALQLRGHHGPGAKRVDRGAVFHQLGASLLDRTICASAGAEALTQTLGNKVGMKVEFYAESKLIVIWGSNSIGSNLHFWRIAQEAKRNGAKLVCIDPRRSETAEKCHEHIALRPGTDAALALALMHELIVHGWLDHDYIDRYTLGWDALKARALQWPPERAAEVCGVPVEQITPTGARLGHDPTRGHSPELRHAARARGRQRGAGDRLPARAHGRLAAPGGRGLAQQLGAFPGAARGACSGPTCWASGVRAPST